eukprot:865231_1
MTMASNDNNGGRIAYASKTAAQLLGLGTISSSPHSSQPMMPRSPQMNHPIALKFNSNKQPLFPSRRHTLAANALSSISAMPTKPRFVRPHSSNEFVHCIMYPHSSMAISIRMK